MREGASVKFRIDKADYTLVRQLMQVTKTESFRQFLVDALSLLSWAIEERRAGRTIASYDPAKNVFKEVHLKPLERAAEAGTLRIGEPA